MNSSNRKRNISINKEVSLSLAFKMYIYSTYLLPCREHLETKMLRLMIFLNILIMKNHVGYM